MIALIFAGDIKYCPYAKRYIERLEFLNINYEFLFWNRSGFDLKVPDNYKYFDKTSDLLSGKGKKIRDFYLFKKWVSKQIRVKKYSKLILLSTLSGIFIRNDLRKYKNNYIFDIRDYSFEEYKLFYHLEKKIIENSYFTAISSKGFKDFLPQAEYVIAHNFNRHEIREGSYFKKEEKQLKFVWNGVMRYFEFQKQYIDALKNDDRFLMVYHGSGPELEHYKNYCKENNISNILFTGSYDNAMKYELLCDADILNNCYGYVRNAGNKLKYAVSNRFYDGVIYHIPQLVENEGYKPKWANESGVGISLNVTNNFADKLYEYYYSINEEDFNRSCEKVKKQVIEEDNEYIRRIDEFINK